METEDDSVRPKRTSRIKKPPKWHQVYVMARSDSSNHLSGQASCETESRRIVVSQGAYITVTQIDVRSLSEELQEIKGMLLGVGEMMKDLQRQRKYPISTGSECSSNQSSPVSTQIQSKHQDDSK